jgi:HlyD family secretion protein
VAEVEAFLKEARLTTPIAGEVVKRNVEPGELVSPGFPVVSVVDLEDVWVTLQLREDRLAGLKPGDVFAARIPALGDRVVPLQVFYVAAQADFATWRATNANGGFDLKTFEVRARPVPQVAGLRPGMSALVRWDRR